MCNQEMICKSCVKCGDLYSGDKIWNYFYNFWTCECLNTALSWAGPWTIICINYCWTTSGDQLCSNNICIKILVTQTKVATSRIFQKRWSRDAALISPCKNKKKSWMIGIVFLRVAQTTPTMVISLWGQSSFVTFTGPNLRLTGHSVSKYSLDS